MFVLFLFFNVLKERKKKVRVVVVGVGVYKSHRDALVLRRGTFELPPDDGAPLVGSAIR